MVTTIWAREHDRADPGEHEEQHQKARGGQCGDRDGGTRFRQRRHAEAEVVELVVCVHVERTLARAHLAAAPEPRPAPDAAKIAIGHRFVELLHVATLVEGAVGARAVLVGPDLGVSNQLVDPDPGNNATFSGSTIGAPYHAQSGAMLYVKLPGAP